MINLYMLIRAVRGELDRYVVRPSHELVTCTGLNPGVYAT